jgi:hypothetical protein
MQRSVSDYLKAISRKKSREDKIKTLREIPSGERTIVHFILEHAFNPAIKFMLPEGPMPENSYKENQTDEAQGRLFSEARKLYLFVEGSPVEHMNSIQRETRWIEILEGIDSEDAKLLISIKDKKVPYRGITKELVQEALGPYNSPMDIG